MKIVIIGGGISGLTTAYYLQKKIAAAGINADVKVIEKEAVIGGKVKSILDKGALHEWGPNGFLDNKPLTLELCEELGISDKLLVSNDSARKRFIYSNGKLYRLAENPLKFFLSGLLSVTGRFRILAEPFIKKYAEKKDETLAAFARRRLGQEALDKLIAPMASGIFAGNPETMSLKACFPRIHQLEQQYGSLIKAMRQIAKARKNEDEESAPASATGPGGKLTSFVNGLQTLTDSLASHIGKDNILNCEISSLTKNQDGSYTLIDKENNKISADIVISALPAYSASQVFTDLDSNLANSLARIKYAPLIVVCSSYEKTRVKHDLDGFGYLLARDETIPVLGTLWDSSIFPNRAPDGSILLRSMLGGARHPNLIKYTDEQISLVVRESYETILDIKFAPQTEKIYRHEQAIPEYGVGHCDLVNEIESSVASHAGLFITGNAFHGVGINDCINSADMTSENVVNYLKALSA